MTTPPTTPKPNFKEIIRSEYKRCAIDPIYFIKKYVYIQEPIKGRILFDLYGYQENALNDFDTFDFNIILKGRQIGISTVVAAYSLWLMMFHGDKNILVIATKETTAKNLITKVHYAFDNLPVWLQNKCVESNKLSLRFKNGSQIKASAASGDAGRSEALSLLVLDEAAFIRNAKEIWVAALPTLSTGGKAILISTPNGVGNFFHLTYSNAIQDVAEPVNGGSKKFHPIKLDWRVHPDRNQQWRDEMGRIQGEREARQEYDADFIGSGATVIDGDLIEEYAAKVGPPLEKIGFDANLWVWKKVNYSRAYAVVADVARGDGADTSAFHVIDIEDCEQVAEYKGKLGTTEYGHMLIEVATMYNDALLVVERENIGWATIQTIIDRGYKNLFYMSKDRKVVEVHRNVTNRYRSEDKQMVPGFGTTISTRPVIVNKLDTYMRDRAVIIHSLRTIEELRVFIWENGKAIAQEGYNDDLVMALSIALWVRDTALKLQQEGLSMTKSALNNIHRTGGDQLPVYGGRHHLPNDPYKLPLSNGLNPDSEDMRWLLG